MSDVSIVCALVLRYDNVHEKFRSVGRVFGGDFEILKSTFLDRKPMYYPPVKQFQLAEKLLSSAMGQFFQPRGSKGSR